MPTAKSKIHDIEKCKGCPLYHNQLPLLDKKMNADVFWVGLSAVKVECTKKEGPLANNTNSGKLIAEIEQRNHRTEFYKTNLVKCLPLEAGKIRYPKREEMKSCCKNLQTEISEIQPKLVFLLGKQVGDFVTDTKNVKLSDEFNYKSFEKDNTIYVPVHHPSFILVYKRKQVDSYIDGISKIIDQFMKRTHSTKKTKMASPVYNTKFSIASVKQ